LAAVVDERLALGEEDDAPLGAVEPVAAGPLFEEEIEFVFLAKMAAEDRAKPFETPAGELRGRRGGEIVGFELREEERKIAVIPSIRAAALVGPEAPLGKLGVRLAVKLGGQRVMIRHPRAEVGVVTDWRNTPNPVGCAVSRLIAPIPHQF